MFEDVTKPLHLLEREIVPQWIDYNGHMTESRYLYLLSEASEVFLSAMGADADYIKAGHSYYTAETHLMHFDEGRLGQKLYVTMQLLHHDEKRVHVFFWIYRTLDDLLLAVGEQLYLHVDMAQSKACAADAAILKNLQKVADGHDLLAMPKYAGRAVGQREKG